MSNLKKTMALGLLGLTFLGNVACGMPSANSEDVTETTVRENIVKEEHGETVVLKDDFELKESENEIETNIEEMSPTEEVSTSEELVVETDNATEMDTTLPDGWYTTSLQDYTGTQLSDVFTSCTKNAWFENDVLVLEAGFDYTATDDVSSLSTSHTVYEIGTYRIQTNAKTVVASIGGEMDAQYMDIETFRRDLAQYLGLDLIMHIENGCATEIYLAS